MTNVVSMKEGAILDPKVIESIVMNGDLSKLQPAQKVAYYNYRCSQAGLDPAAKPFDLLKLNGKEILYANAQCTQQLCAIHKLSTQVTHREKMDDIYLVSVRVTGADGRLSENQGAVAVAHLKGDALANAVLKATTKAIRRAVLAHCGLGMLDETEAETIPNARMEPMVQVSTEAAPSLSEILAKPADGIALMVPGSEEPYAYYETMDKWADAFLTMFDKIAANKKMDAGTKLLKMGDFEKCNTKTIHELARNHEGLYSVFSGGVGSARALVSEEAKKQ
jgi:hypothetical protein